MTARLTAMGIAVVLLLASQVACEPLNCGWRVARVTTTSWLPLTLELEDLAEGDVSLDLTTARIETADVVSGSAPLVPYGDGMWGFDHEQAPGHSSFGYEAPWSLDCQGAYNATLTFSLTLPKKWPAEIADAHPPLTFNLTRDELYRGVEVCLWDGWCPTVKISEH